MKLLIVLSTLLASLSSFAVEDIFVVLHHRSKSNQYEINAAKVRVTFEQFQDVGRVYTSCLYENRTTNFAIMYGQMNGISDSKAGMDAQAPWIFSFNELKTTTVDLGVNADIFDMAGEVSYNRLRNIQWPKIEEIEEIPISRSGRPSDLIWVNGFACIRRAVPQN